MASTRKRRALVTVVATVGGRSCLRHADGILNWAIDRVAADRGQAQPEAAHISRLSEEFSQDTNAALTQMNASNYPFCSEADLEYIRNILFHSHFLKEAGRIRDGRIACSATFGRVHLPAGEQPKPDFVAPNGMKLYRNLPAFRLEHWMVLTS